MPINLSGSLVLTGSITTTGTISMSGSIASASYASNTSFLNNSGSGEFVPTGSFNTFSSSILTHTGSTITRLNSIEIVTGSNLTRLSSIESKTGSYATTGSNTFIGTQTISGSVLQSGSFTTTGTIIAQTINVQTVTSSIVYSSGSNIFGNLLGDSQRFTGSVLITGSLTISTGGNASAPTIFGSTIACSPIGCFATSCATSFIGGTMSGTTIYGSTAVCSAVGKFTTCLDLGGALTGTSATFSSTNTATAFIPSGATVPTNGMYLSAANTVDFATNTTNRLTITSGGDVAIGADGNSIVKLLVRGKDSGSSNYAFIAQNSSTTNLFLVKNDGNVSAYGSMSGTTIYGSTAVCSPVGKFTSCIDAGTGTFSGNALTLSGNNPALTLTTSDTTLYSYIALTGGTSSNYIYTLSNSYNTTGPYVAGALTLVGTTSGGISIAAQCASGLIRFYTCEQERMRITSGGSLLIGSTTQAYNPQTQGYLLGVKSNTTQAFISIAKSGQTLDSGGMIVGLDTTTGYVLVQANIALSLATNDTERMRITSTGISCFACQVCAPSGVKFGSGTTTLNYYEEGSWTPTFSNSSTTPSYLTQTGKYTRIGRVVHVVGKVGASNLGSGTVYIGGLPFSSADANDAGQRVSARAEGDWSGFNCTHLLTSTMFRASGTTFIGVRDNGSGQSIYADHSSYGSTLYFNFHGTYYV